MASARYSGQWQTFFMKMGWMSPSFSTESGNELSVRESLENVTTFVSVYLGFNPEEGDGLGPVFYMHIDGPPGCPLCSEKFVIGENLLGFEKCRHKFHKVCIEGFRSLSLVCPVCHVIETYKAGEPMMSVPIDAAAPANLPTIKQELLKVIKDVSATFTVPVSSTSKDVKVHTC